MPHAVSLSLLLVVPLDIGGCASRSPVAVAVATPKPPMTSQRVPPGAPTSQSPPDDGAAIEITRAEKSYT